MWTLRTAHPSPRMLSLLARPRAMPWRPAASLLIPSARALFSTSSPASAATPPPQHAGGKQLVDISNHPIIKRLPPFLHPYTLRFLNAPVSHVTAFLVLHELTAVVPLFGLWALFARLDWDPLASGLLPRDLLDAGAEYIRVLGARNGWTELEDGAAGSATLVLQGAAAYALVKVLMPLRALLSLAAMPWFARCVVVPFTRLFARRRASRNAPAQAAPHAQPPAQPDMPLAAPERHPAPADPTGQLWNQGLPAEPPAFKPKKTDPNRPSL